MRTEFEKNIANQLQNIEDSLHIDDWDDFNHKYTRYRRAKRIRMFAPVLLVALLMSLFVRNGSDNSGSEHGLETSSYMLADNLPAINNHGMESMDEPVALNDQDIPAALDTLCCDASVQQEDNLSEHELNTGGEVSSTKEDTIQSHSSRQEDYHVDLPLGSSLSKKNSPAVNIGFSGGRGLPYRAGLAEQISGAGSVAGGGVKEDVKYTHVPPISFGISLNVKIYDRLTFVTGLDYSLYLTHNYFESAHYSRKETQQLHYLGLPLMFNYSILSNESCEWYAGGGFEVEKCIFGRYGSASIGEKNLLWSAALATGVQYNLTEGLSIFCEPYCSYLISNTAMVSYRSENPFEISARIGVRVNL